MTISERIFKLLDEKGKKQKDLAVAAGISTSAISDWKKKNTNPSADIISAIADFLQVPVTYLLTGKEKSSPTEQMSDDERELLTYYKKLDTISKGKVIGKAEALAEAAAEKKTVRWQ